MQDNQYLNFFKNLFRQDLKKSDTSENIKKPLIKPKYVFL